MIKLNDVNLRLKKIYDMHTGNLESKDKSTLTKEALKLELCKKYLEFEPNESFVLSEVVRIERAIPILERGYSDWFTATPEAKQVKNAGAKFRKDTGITDMSRQIKMLKFLINGKVNP